jgi:uncharacterized membrane protein
MEKPADGVTADAQVARIFEWRRGFNTIHLIDLGIKLGLFKALADSPGSTAQSLAEKLALHAPYVETWCKTAYGMEILDGDADGRWRLAPYFDAILANTSHPRYLGGYVRLGTEVAADDFKQLEHAFRRGDTNPFQGRGTAFAQAIAESTWGLQLATAKKLLPELPEATERLAAGGAILEVGCGSGNLLMQLAKSFPQARCIGVDIDEESVQLAQQRIEHAQLSHRVEARKGTVAEVALPNSFDVAVITATTAVIQPLTGIWLAQRVGWPLTQRWLLWSLVLYAIAIACWLPVVRLQIRMRDDAVAALAAGTPLPESYFRRLRAWVALGVPAFAAFVAIFWLMVAKPV